MLESLVTPIITPRMVQRMMLSRVALAEFNIAPKRNCHLVSSGKSGCMGHALISKVFFISMKDHERSHLSLVTESGLCRRKSSLVLR